MLNNASFYPTILVLFCHIFNISLCQQPKYFCDENDSTASYNIFLADGAMHDCGPNGGGDSLIYYCCNGIARYCLSKEAGCFWSSNSCPAQYDDYTCHIPANPHCPHHYLLAYTIDNVWQYYCHPQSYEFYTNHPSPSEIPSISPTQQPTGSLHSNIYKSHYIQISG